MESFQEIKKYLDQLENSWRDYIFRYSFFKKHFSFNEEMKEDAPGVIFGYLQDTLPIILNYGNDNKSNTLDDYFLYSIGLLQILYIHQDLIYELNRTFGFTHDTKNLKSRALRNELIGHPISRNKKYKTLDSLCLFGYQTNLNQITYLKYSRENNFDFESKEYSTHFLINEHLSFLQKNFKLIQQEINKSLHEFKRELTNFIEEIQNMDINQIIKFIDNNFDDFYSENFIFKKVNILECKKKLTSHTRYEYNLNLFKTELIVSVKEYINNI